MDTALSGGYRTICVRSCDGYYWPISYSVSTKHFSADAQACTASCPNQNVSLFVHRASGQWSENAVGLDGTPMTKLEAALLYRREYKPECKCAAPLTNIAAHRGADRGNSLAEATTAKGTPGGLEPAAKSGVFGPPPATEPMSFADGSGTPAAKEEIARLGASADAAPPLGPRHPVRVVGPHFTPDG